MAEPDPDASEPGAEQPADPLSIFEEARSGEAGATPAPDATDGRDPGVLPMALLGLAVVGALVAGLALVNGRTVFGLVLVGAAALLGWGARASWEAPVRVSVVHGVVVVAQGEEEHRFDLRTEATRVEMHGQPGDVDWQVRFPRRGREPVVVHGAHVDAARFVAQLREHRPDL